MSDVQISLAASSWIGFLMILNVNVILLALENRMHDSIHLIESLDRLMLPLVV